jgi:hypothetical protein
VSGLGKVEYWGQPEVQRRAPASHPSRYWARSASPASAAPR